MSKQEGRGFALHGFNWHCLNCCCSVCTGLYCPDRKRRYGWYKYHCAPCVESNGAMRRVLDCDFFQNKHTSKRRFKIKRKFHREDAVITRLNAIMEKLDIPTDSENTARHNYLNADVVKLIDDYNKKG